MAKNNTNWDGDAIVELNRNLLGTRYPYMDSQFAKGCLHVLLGQLPNMLKLRYNIQNSRLDLRTHFMVLSPSGTNKGSVFTYMDEVCNQLNGMGIPMKYKFMGKFTDSALVGTPGVKTEKRDKVDEDGEVERDADGKIIKVTEEVDNPRYGALHPSFGNSILAWSEGSQVLDVQAINLNQNTMNILQQCMNPMDTADNIVSKSTGLGEIAFNTTCSLFMVSYKPMTITQKIVGTGFLQRQIVIIREPTSEQRKDVAVRAVDGLTREPAFKEPLTELVKKLDEVNQFAGTIDSLYVPDSVKDLLKSKSEQFHATIKNSNILVRQKLGEFVSRWSVNILYNLMFHHAILCKRSEVNQSDVLYASEFLFPVWTDFSAFLENALLMDKRETEIISRQYAYVMITYHRLVREAQERRDAVPEEERENMGNVEGYIQRDDLVTRLALDWARSRSAVNELLRQIEEDLFVHKYVRFDEIDDDDLPANCFLKLKPEALRIITVR